jgi:hypothetical protein
LTACTPSEDGTVYDSTDGGGLRAMAAIRFLAREIGGTLDAEIAESKTN